MVGTGGAAFPELQADESNVEVVESLCMNCHKQGETRLLCMAIPFFRDVVLMSFTCPECGHRSSEVQKSGAVGPQGVSYTIKIDTPAGLSRNIVKSDTCAIRVPELELEIPANSSPGQLTNVEGILARVIEGVTQRLMAEDSGTLDAANREKLQEFVRKVEDVITGKTLPFTMIVDDAAGNSFVENPMAPAEDPALAVHRYNRTQAMNAAIGLSGADAAADAAAAAGAVSAPGPNQAARPGTGVPVEEGANVAILQQNSEDVIEFEETCSYCRAATTVKMYTTHIPYFKDVILMATSCDQCGYKSSEVRAGGAIPERGTRYELKVDGEDDMNRDVLKSSTATLRIPEVRLELEGGAVGGRFTTVEGLMKDILDQLRTSNPFALGGDSAEAGQHSDWINFLAQLAPLATGGKPFTLVVDDPAGASYIQNLFAPDPDPSLKVEHYERTKEQNDDLGLTDMKTEGYEGR